MDPNQVPAGHLSSSRSSTSRHDKPSPTNADQAVQVQSSQDAFLSSRRRSSPVDLDLDMEQIKDGDDSQPREIKDEEGVESALWSQQDPPSHWTSRAVTNPLTPLLERSTEPSESQSQASREPSVVPEDRAPPTPPPTSALLTSEPLNRSANNSISPESIGPSEEVLPPTPISPFEDLNEVKLGKRVRRSNSFPLACPEAKRLRTSPPPGPPSDEKIQEWINEVQNGTISSTPVVRPIKQRTFRIGQLLGTAQPPLINSATLAALDPSKILRNPQHRHDLLFDSLTFGRTFKTPSPTKIALQKEDPRMRQVIDDLYWECLDEEIKTGCRCTRWIFNPPADTPDGDITIDSIIKRQRVAGCVCGKWQKELSEEDWWKHQEGKYKSRIPDVIDALSTCLGTVMTSSAACPEGCTHSPPPGSSSSSSSSSGSSNSSSGSASPQCAMYTNVLTATLQKSLDPQFLTVQARRGVFDLNIFDRIGFVMKHHCAPLRDPVVDEMVKVAMSGDVARGLRQCFSCAEMMKIDITNHQIIGLRPRLWNTAREDEQKALRRILKAADIPLEDSLLRPWIRSASIESLKSHQPAERSKFMASRLNFTLASLVEGYLQIIFCHQHERHVDGSAKANAEGKVPHGEYEKFKAKLPETLRLDYPRIKNFGAEVEAFTSMHLALLALEHLLKLTHPNMEHADWSERLYQCKLEMAGIFKEHCSIFPPESELGDKTVFGSGIAFRLTLKLYGPELKRSDENTGETGFKLPFTEEQLRFAAKTSKTLHGMLRRFLDPHGEVLRRALKTVRQTLRQLLTSAVQTHLGVGSTYAQQLAAGIQADAALAEAEASTEIIQPVNLFSAAQASQHQALQSRTSPLPPTENSATTTIRLDGRPLCKGPILLKKIERRPDVPISRDHYTAHFPVLRHIPEAGLDVIRRAGLQHLETEMALLTERMYKIIGFNAFCFADVYAGDGMVVGKTDEAPGNPANRVDLDQALLLPVTTSSTSISSSTRD